MTTETYTVPAVSNWIDGSNDRNYTLTSDTVIEMYSYNRAGQVTGKRMRITTSADDQSRTAGDAGRGFLFRTPRLPGRLE